MQHLLRKPIPASLSVLCLMFFFICCYGLDFAIIFLNVLLCFLVVVFSDLLLSLGFVNVFCRAAQWVALPPPGFDPQLGFDVCRVTHALSMFTWVSSGFFGVLPLSKTCMYTEHPTYTAL